LLRHHPDRLWGWQDPANIGLLGHARVEPTGTEPRDEHGGGIDPEARTD